MVDVSFLKVDFHNLAKLFRSGRIDNVYARMYSKACEIAIFETKKFSRELIDIETHHKITSQDEVDDRFKKIMDYQQSRIEYHMKEMKELLTLHLQEQKRK